MNILVMTYGTTWHLLPEVLGFTNADDVHFFDNHPDLDVLQQLRSLHVRLRSLIRFDEPDESAACHHECQDNIPIPFEHLGRIK